MSPRSGISHTDSACFSTCWSTATSVLTFPFCWHCLLFHTETGQSYCHIYVLLSTLPNAIFPQYHSLPNHVANTFFLAHVLLFLPSLLGLSLLYYLWVACLEFWGCSWFTDTSHFLSSAPKMSVLAYNQPLAPNFSICYFLKLGLSCFLFFPPCCPITQETT